ncbi:MAG: RNA polymerase sigma factor [Planctomycetota bacterium]
MWGHVRALSRDAEAGSQEEAWRHLVDVYQPALVTFVRGILKRTSSVSPGEAEDVVQGFLAACLEKGWLEQVDPNRGTFRGFIFTRLRSHALDYVRWHSRKRRRPEGGLAMSLDPGDALEPSYDEQALDTLLRAEWAKCLVRAAIERVRGRSAASARLVEAACIQGVADAGELAMIAGVATTSMREHLRRARTRFAEALWSEMKESLLRPDDLEEERAALLPWLGPYLDPVKNPSFFGMGNAS